MNNIKPNLKARQRGTTLIELSVVIAVILLLVGVLFIGVTAWKNGANAAACVVNLATIQKAVRGYQNMNQVAVGGACTMANLITQQYFGAAPACPGGGVYAYTGTIPGPGTPYATCSLAGNSPPHQTNTANW